MPDNINPYEKTRAGWITTWTVKDSSSGDNDEVEAIKAAESGNTHFITFITVSTDSDDVTETNVAASYDPLGAVSTAGTTTRATTAAGAIRVYLTGGTTVIWEAWPSDLTGNNPAHFEFSSPIQISEGDLAKVTSVMPGSADRVTVTFGGFTDNNRSS